MIKTDLVQFGLNCIHNDFNTLVISAVVVCNCGPTMDSPLGNAVADRSADAIFESHKKRFWDGILHERGLYGFPAIVAYEVDEKGGLEKILHVETLEDEEIDRLLKALA